LNVSAEGFRLGCNVDAAVGPAVDPTVKVGDVAILETGNGSHEVRVANTQRENGTLLLGLLRLAELREPASRARAAHAGTKINWRRSDSPFLSPLGQFAILVAIVALVLIAVNLPQMDPVKAVEATPGEGGRVAHARGRAASSDAVLPNDKRNGHTPLENLSRARTSSHNSLSGKSAEPIASTRQGGKTAGQSERDPEVSPVPPSTEPSSAADVAVQKRDFAGPTAGNQPNAEDLAAAKQETLFDPKSDATINIAAALKTANRDNKRVLVEFGANTCDSCRRLHDLFTKNAEISAAFHKAFVLVAVDSDANQKLVARFVPDERRHHLPFLALLDKEGKVLRIQGTDAIEDGQNIDIAKVKAFLQRSTRSK
jgi:thiol-disulfide isomerase/thioredoxin